MKLKLILVLLVSLIALLAYNFTFYLKAYSSAYIYGYPLLIMEKTKKAMLGGPVRENQLIHSTHFPDHTFRSVVRPNVDTLYSVAWLDLSQEPQVLSVPEMGDRYYISPFMDAWTNVFASVGTRTMGNKAGDYVIVGPDWPHDLPSDINTIQSPTNMVWLIQRINTKGRNDFNQVKQMQQQFSLASLSQWRQGKRAEHHVSSSREEGKNDPQRTIDAMTADQFFSTLAELLRKQSPLPGDEAALLNLASIGLTPGNYSPDSQTCLSRSVANLALKLTRRKIKSALAEEPGLENGWTIFRKGTGRYGTDYKLRAGVSMVGLGALPPEDALYTNTLVDSVGQVLSGKHRYRLRFDAGETPPVDAFWSITMYDEDGYLVENGLKRYALGDRDALSYNDDGSLDIVIQRSEPDSQINNWLPTPKGNFVLTLRLYAPQTAAIKGHWPLPSVIKQ